MGQKISGLLLTLDKDITTEQLAAVTTLLGLIEGVAGVRPVPTSYELSIAADRARMEIRRDIMKILFPSD